MRILGVGEDGDLGDMYARLQRAGHEVRMYIGSEDARSIHEGIVPKCDDWEKELPWVRAAGADGIIVFESATYGLAQDTLRSEGFNVIGGSAYGDRLEADRRFGQDALRGLDLRYAPMHAFSAFDEAIAFVQRAPKRYVFKINGASALRTRSFIGQLESGADMVALLATYRSQHQTGADLDFVLMEHIAGVEVGVGAYFDGERFLEPACLDWEHKRFFTGDLGELTGEMGTIVTYRGSRGFFERTLRPLAPALRLSGYCGYINLNLIANQEGLWPIEFTSRFGYPGYAICEALHREPWDAIFRKLLSRRGGRIETMPGYAAGVVLTVPPFPYPYGYRELSAGLPICFRDPLSAADLENLHFAEVALRGDQLVTSGVIGYVGVATGAGATVELAREKAYQLAAKVVVPNLRYRTDIGLRVIEHDLHALSQLGYWSPEDAGDLPRTVA